MTVTVIQGNARNLPLPDDTVDLVVTSPPYFALRSYTDGGVHYPGQVGAEATPAEFVDALIEVTRECVRVLKPCGSLWVNLGDKYAGGGGQWDKDERPDPGRRRAVSGKIGTGGNTYGLRPKSLIGIPWRYALRCIDDLGLILRAEVIWSKPNGLPESVTDRVRRSHETWFHFVTQPRYFSAVDEIREPHVQPDRKRADMFGGVTGTNGVRHAGASVYTGPTNLLGKLPGSVWTVPTEPLKVPEHLGVDHFAAFPSEFPKRIISGWSPSGVCTGCGEGRRPVVDNPSPFGHVNPCRSDIESAGQVTYGNTSQLNLSGGPKQRWKAQHPATITGYACACPDTTAPTRPAVVLDVFGGTGTTAHVASALGRHGISLDMSADYCRLAADPTVADGRLRKVLGIEKVPAQVTGQDALFG